MGRRYPLLGKGHSLEALLPLADPQCSAAETLAQKIHCPFPPGAPRRNFWPMQQVPLIFSLPLVLQHESENCVGDTRCRTHGYSVKAQLCLCNAKVTMSINGHACVPIKLYSDEQTEGRVCHICCSRACPCACLCLCLCLRLFGSSDEDTRTCHLCRVRSRATRQPGCLTR